MDWYFQVKNETQPSGEGLGVDCDRCRVLPSFSRSGEYSSETKCCEFSPFVSVFAVGSLIQGGVDVCGLVEASEGELLLTRLGIIHSRDHRVTDGALCRFYNLDQRNCSIWNHRPPICFSFFCTLEGAKTFSSVETSLLEGETFWLKQWFFEKWGRADLWEQWGLYMEPRPLVSLSEELLIESWGEAQSLYLESVEWLQKLKSTGQENGACDS